VVCEGWVLTVVVVVVMLYCIESDREAVNRNYSLTHREAICVCISGPFPCKSISKIVWKSTKT